MTDFEFCSLSLERIPSQLRGAGVLRVTSDIERCVFATNQSAGSNTTPAPGFVSPCANQPGLARMKSSRSGSACPSVRDAWSQYQNRLRKLFVNAEPSFDHGIWAWSYSFRIKRQKTAIISFLTWSLVSGSLRCTAKSDQRTNTCSKSSLAGRAKHRAGFVRKSPRQ